MEIALLTTKNGNLLLLYPTLILMGRKSTHNWPTHVWLLVRILKMRAEFVWSLFIGVIKSCFIFILSNSTSFTIWSSQFAFSTRSNWTGNSNGTWTDKQSTTCKHLAITFSLLKFHNFLWLCLTTEENIHCFYNLKKKKKSVQQKR